MPRQYAAILKSLAVRVALKQAWQDSKSGVGDEHEEGGFILRDAAGNVSVVRWPPGGQNSISLPSHPSCRIGMHDIVATFHTHPNTGSNYLQEPSETDKRAVRDDPDLKGEFVISARTVYLIAPDGQVSEIGDMRDIVTGRTKGV